MQKIILLFGLIALGFLSCKKKENNTDIPLNTFNNGTEIFQAPISYHYDVYGRPHWYFFTDSSSMFHGVNITFGMGTSLSAPEYLPAAGRYKVVKNAMKTDEVTIGYIDNPGSYYELSYEGQATASIEYVNGKLHIAAAGIPMIENKYYSGATGKSILLSFNLLEK